MLSFAENRFHYLNNRKMVLENKFQPSNQCAIVFHLIHILFVTKSSAFGFLSICIFIIYICDTTN